MSIASDSASAAGAPAALSPAVAPPPGNPRFPQFDSLRALGVLGVLLFHVASFTGAFNGHESGNLIAVLGDEAVIVFFATSGFMLYRPFVLASAEGRPRPSARRYARRRLLRIVPGYWVALTLLAIFPGITGPFGSDWWRYYFFLQIYSSHTISQGIPQAWTLCVELTFYISLPVWAILIRRLRRALRAGWLVSELVPLVFVALFGVAVQVAASRLKVSSLLTTTLLGECVWFALGMSLAVWSVANQHAAQPGRVVRLISDYPLGCWALAAACVLGATAVLHPGGLLNIVLSLHTRQPYGRTLGGLVLQGGACAALFVTAMFGSGGFARRVLTWAPLAWLGLVSYGVYLYQLGVVEYLVQKHAPLNFSATGLGLHLSTVVLFIISLAISAVLAAVSYQVIELPFLRRKESKRVSAPAA
ncbi:MAG TPA: acyltransferase [Solirubrobacteraceae bacterium]|nr:acyltransferase [Solirubrobacteraceae bacterium]